MQKQTAFRERCIMTLSEEKGLTKNQEKDRFESFRDKIVLTWESKGVFVRRAMEAGAKAVLHICATKVTIFITAILG